MVITLILKITIRLYYFLVVPIILHTILLESIPLNLITYLFQWIIMELKAAVAK